MQMKKKQAHFFKNYAKRGQNLKINFFHFCLGTGKPNRNSNLKNSTKLLKKNGKRI